MVLEIPRKWSKSENEALPETEKSKLYHDSAIVCALEVKPNASDGNSQAKDFYDQGNRHASHRKLRSHVPNSVSREPEWYSHGPSNIDDVLNFHDGKLTADGDENNRSCCNSRAEEEKENNFKVLENHWSLVRKRLLNPDGESAKSARTIPDDGISSSTTEISKSGNVFY